MHWDGYTVFSVITGVILLGTGLLGVGMHGKDRLYGFLGGAFFLGYGIYVAKQTSGTYFFPVWIFILPFLYLGAAILGAFNKRRRASQADSASTHYVDAAGPGQRQQR